MACTGATLQLPFLSEEKQLVKDCEKVEMLQVELGLEVEKCTVVR
jgi:hypothetical protein